MNRLPPLPSPSPPSCPSIEVQIEVGVEEVGEVGEVGMLERGRMVIRKEGNSS